jgi:hypothetical protein
MEDLKTSLESELTTSQKEDSELRESYDRVLTLATTLAHATNRNLRKDVTALLREARPHRIDSTKLARAVLTALAEMGGSARQDEVRSSVEQLVGSELSEFDRTEANSRGEARWLSNLYRARKELVRDGKLTVGKGKNAVWRIAR